MDALPDLIQEYRSILAQEKALEDRKEIVKAAILQAMTSRNAKSFQAPAGTALRCVRFSLQPKLDPVLATLSPEDLFPFLRFTPARVRALLVPKYGRDRLLPLFDVQSSPYVLVKPPAQPLATPAEPNDAYF